MNFIIIVWIIILLYIWYIIVLERKGRKWSESMKTLQIHHLDRKYFHFYDVIPVRFFFHLWMKNLDLRLRIIVIDTILRNDFLTVEHILESISLLILVYFYKVKLLTLDF